MAATTTKSAEDVFTGQFSKKSADTLSFLGELNEANHKVLTGVVEFSASTAKEALRLYSDLQAPVLATLKSAQELITRRQGEMQDAQKDPMGWYQKSLQETLEAAQANLKLLETSARTISQSAERLQASGEQTSKEIQQTLSTLGGRLKTLYTSAV
jgi:hypothetical protein